MSQFDVCHSPLLVDLTDDKVRGTYEEMLTVWDSIFRGLILEPEASNSICEVGEKSNLDTDEFGYICRRSQRDVLEIITMEQEGDNFRMVESA